MILDFQQTVLRFCLFVVVLLVFVVVVFVFACLLVCFGLFVFNPHYSTARVDR